MNAEAVTTIRNVELIAIFAMAWGLAIVLRHRGTGNGLLASIAAFFTINALFYTWAVVTAVLEIKAIPEPWSGLVLVTGLLVAHLVLTWAALVRRVTA